MIAAFRPESLRSRVFGTTVSSSISPLVPSCFVLASSACWRSVESASDGAVCRAAPAAALLGPLVELANVCHASRQCPWLLRGRQSRQPLVCSTAAMAHRDWPSVTVAPVVSTPIQVMRRAGCRQRRPSVHTATHRPLAAPEV